jgi:molecular chaperone GrpE
VPPKINRIMKEDIDESEFNEEFENQENKEIEQNEETLSQEELLQIELDALNNKYLRLYSDFENYRKRTAKEKLDLIETSNSDLLSTLLPVIDDFDRAIVSNENTEDPEELKTGFLLIYNKLINIIEMEGVKPMNAVGETFDVDFHEAITKIPAPDKSMKGKVIDVVEKGFFIKDKVLRYAKVVVGA